MLPGSLPGPPMVVLGASKLEKYGFCIRIMLFVNVVVLYLEALDVLSWVHLCASWTKLGPNLAQSGPQNQHKFAQKFVASFEHS